MGESRLPTTPRIRFAKLATKLTQQLMLADLRRKTIESLSSSSDWVRAFDVRDREHYVYVVADHAEWDRQAQSKDGAFVGTGFNIWKMFFPDDPYFRAWEGSSEKLWAVADGKPLEVKNSANGARFQIVDDIMSLSPDGRSLAILAPVDEVPPSWEALYPPPKYLSYSGYSSQHPIQPGRGTAKQYVWIDLKSGSTHPLAGAPSMGSVGILNN